MEGGGGERPTDDFFQTCRFCNHNYVVVDESPQSHQNNAPTK
ncbi:MAG: hypothetical protein ACI8RD_006646 [Bacillariaceae sp.]|jgi:hypothetical protein